jgi:hypothetical protein
MALAKVPSQHEEYQRIMRQKEKDARKWANENLDQKERFGIVWNPDGIGFRLGINSSRGQEPLLRLHKEVFSDFELINLSRRDDGEWTAWVGFSPPAQYQAVI